MEINYKNLTFHFNMEPVLFMFGAERTFIETNFQRAFLTFKCCGSQLLLDSLVLRHF
jgi:hypothetical protein